MKEDICSIPVNEVLEARDGCPICRMHHTLEEAALEFVMGAAMMEPDIRSETNREGFCSRHYDGMLKRKNRLSLALMLQSHLEAVEQEIFEKQGLFFSENKKLQKAGRVTESCYVCRRIDEQMGRLIHTFFILWKKEQEFRENVAAQPMFCLPHYTLLMQKGMEELDKKSVPDFSKTLTGVTRRGLSTLKEDVDGFCRMFDYRNNGGDWGNSKDAIERSILFLTGRKMLP